MASVYKTPIKQHNQSSNSSHLSSLKMQIQSKISSNKQPTSNFQSRQNQYNTNVKDKQNSKACNFSTIQNNCKKYRSQSKIIEKNENLISYHNNSVKEQDILLFQSCKNPGFYNFQGWLQFNNSYFGHVDQNIVRVLWKILRILNYGQVLIPSGLVYEISLILDRTDQNKKTSKISLKQALNNFLRMNRIQDNVDSFRQLKFYMNLNQIQQSYTLKNNNFNKISNEFPQQNVFQRIYNDAKTRNQTRNQMQCLGIIEKQLNKQYSFQPKINNYYPSKLFVDEQQETRRPQRICYHKQKWKSRTEDQKALYVQKRLGVGQIDLSIYQTNVDQIPGVADHINRAKYSQANKQRKLRYLEKPTLVCKYK